MFRDARLLIIEDETLIGLDIQRVVDDQNGRNTVFARNFNEFAQSADSVLSFDLAIVNPPQPGTADGRIFDRLVSAGTAIVICSAAMPPGATTVSRNHQLVAKPFSDDELLAACRRALATRQRK